MVTKNGVSLQVDTHKRIGVADVINMLKGLRAEAVIKIVRTSEVNGLNGDNEKIENINTVANTLLLSSSVKGNTDLPQIRELNEIASLLRSMENQQNQFST